MEERKHMNKCFKKADILLPNFEKNDAARWAVIACDQFTSEPEYWEKAEQSVGEAPSTLNVILPEVYLSETEQRVPMINATMKKYIQEVLVEHEDTAVYVERVQSDGSVRRGVVLAVDLECYDYNKGAASLIRATEATVLERIPPRVAVRRDAPIELPHVMLLIDDPKRTVIEPLASSCTGETAYDTELMLGGGHITGRYLSDADFDRLSDSLSALITPESMKARYGDAELVPLMFAVGDGNHSLATAKAVYEEIKAKLGEEQARVHPARYALAEIVNIHDEALKFEPIYRVMFGVDAADVLKELKKYTDSLDGRAQAQRINCIVGESEQSITVCHPIKQLTVATLQDFIDKYISEHKGAEVDYIHGTASLRSLSKKQGAIGFEFDGMSKSELFKTVMFDGALPRKTFSMGHAEDKRYYIEARKIK